MVSLSGRAPVPPPSLLAGLVRAEALVTLVDESGLRGVVWSADESGLVLSSAAGTAVEYMAPEPGAEWVPVNGAVFVPAERVKFIQMPGGVT